LDAVAQLFTAFGYFSSDEENAGVIEGVAEVLRPGGWYMLDFFNAGQVSEALKPRTERETAEGLVVEERRIEAGRIEKDITLFRPEGERRYRESVRLFTPDEIRAMLHDAGFGIVEVFGSYTGSRFHAASERCIFLARNESRS
jgi:hypothetical protein